MEEMVRYAYNTNLLAKSSNDLKQLWMKVKQESANRTTFAHQEEKNDNYRRNIQL